MWYANNYTVIYLIRTTKQIYNLTIGKKVNLPRHWHIAANGKTTSDTSIFMLPLLDIYTDMLHSYIIELKYARNKDTDEKMEHLRQEAIKQANRYACSETVQKAVGTTTLHKIVVVYRGMEMVVCEEIL